MASAEIGSTGLSVTRLGLGGAGPPGGSFHGTTAAAAHATLERAYELARGTEQTGRGLPGGRAVAAGGGAVVNMSSLAAQQSSPSRSGTNHVRAG